MMYDDALKSFIVEHALELTPELVRRHADVIPTLFQASLIGDLDARDEKLPDIFLYFMELVTSFDAALVYLWEPRRQWHCRGLVDEIPDNLEQGNLFTDFVRMNGKPILIQDFDKAGLNPADCPLSFASMLAMPIYQDTQVIGCVELYRRGDLPFDLSDLVLIKHLMLYSEKALSATLSPEVDLDQSLGLRLDLPQKHAVIDILHQYEEQARRLTYPLTVAIVSLGEDARHGLYQDMAGGLKTVKTLLRHIRSGLRCYDKVFRYEETSFFLILPGCAAREGLTVIDGILNRLSADITGPVHAGLAALPYEAQDAKGLLGAAHQALSFAEKNGLKRASFAQTAAARPANMSLELELIRTFNSGPSLAVLELMLDLTKRQCQAREILVADEAPGQPVMWGSTCLGYLRQQGLSDELTDWLLTYLTPAWAVLAGVETDKACWDQSLLATVSILSDLRAGYPMGYSLKVADQMYDLAKAMDKDEITALTWANTALAANIGYLGISSSIFTKDEISPFDRFKINHHPLIAARLLKNAAILNLDQDVLVHHHEHLDGSGYPRGLKGRNIPDGARALRVVDTFNAMVSPRLYRAPHAPEEALEELTRLAGSELDPELTGLYRKVIGF